MGWGGPQFLPRASHGCKGSRWSEAFFVSYGFGSKWIDAACIQVFCHRQNKRVNSEPLRGSSHYPFICRVAPGATDEVAFGLVSKYQVTRVFNHRKMKKPPSASLTEAKDLSSESEGLR